jgi:peptidoglycan/LPS O-acetylase OafA/YrhL
MVGVDLFFVLSSFLVSGLLFSEIKKTGSVKLGRFLIRRGLKIYPSFYIFIFFTIFGYAVLNRDINSRSLFGELTFLQNYNSSLWNHT